jgi:hypothetical protein
MNIHEMQRSDVVQWMAHLGSKQDNGKPYAKFTLLGSWRTLCTVLRDALVLCDLDKNIVDGILFTVRGVDPVMKDVLTVDELRKLLDGAEHEKPDMRAMIWHSHVTIEEKTMARSAPLLCTDEVLLCPTVVPQHWGPNKPPETTLLAVRKWLF